MSARPIEGPSRIATATARFNSTTGDGFIPANSSYSLTICPQSVVAALAASACTAVIAACRV